VTVVINDTYGFPIPNKLGTLQTTRGSAQDTITPNTGTTNVLGQVSFAVASGYAGWDTITARCDGNSISRAVVKYGAVGIYELDTGAKDISLSANNGNPTFDTAPRWTYGKFGSALEFVDQVNDAVNLEDPVVFSTALTVIAWANCSDTTGCQAIFNNNQVFIRKDSPAEGNRFTAFVATDVYEPRAYSTVVPNTGTWYQVAGTWDGVTLTIYVNGNYEGQSTRAEVLAGDVTAQIGCGVGGGTYDHPWKGLIDDVKLYDRCLTAAEIKADYNRNLNCIFNATKFVFDTPQRDVHTDAVSDSVSIRASGNLGGSDLTANTASLVSSSATGEFSVSPTTWQNTNLITLTNGTAVFYYKDTAIGTFTITVFRAGLQIDTQLIVISGEKISVMKYAKVVRTGVESTATVSALEGDTIEYRLVMTNTGEVTGVNMVLTDTISFDTVMYPPGTIYIYVDTATFADSWTYTLNDTSSWAAYSANPAFGALNVKGLRWFFNAISPNGGTKTVTFRVKVQ